MRILITGASGFIGGNFARHLSYNTNHNIYTCSRKAVKKNYGNHYPIDLTKTEDVKGMVESIKPDAIFHIAANPIVKLKEGKPTEIIHDNVIATQNLLHYAPQSCKFIFASSVVVYGDVNEVCTEDQVCNPTSVYGVTKLSSEHLVNTYTSMDRVRGTNFRLCATVGRGITHGIVYDFINKLKSDNPYLEVIGDYPGSQKPFAHITDVIKALKLSINKDLKGTFNVTPEDQATVKDVAQAVSDGLKIHKPVDWLGEGANWKGDNKKLCINSKKLINAGWQPEYSLSKSAIENAVNEIKGDIK